MPWNDVLRRRMQPLTATMTSNRIIIYAIFSTGAMMGAILNACRNQSNFYAVTVYLSRSGRSLLVSYDHSGLFVAFEDLYSATSRFWLISVFSSRWRVARCYRRYSLGHYNLVKSRYGLFSHKPSELSSFMTYCQS